MTTPVRPVRTAPHTATHVTLNPARRPAPQPTRAVRPAQPVDPWRWHDYATRVANVERAAWETAADAVEHSAVDIRALCALRRTDRAVGALGSRLGLTSGGATKLCRRLVELGLVERKGIADDLRGVQISLTEAGRDVAHRAALVYAEQVRRRAAEMHLAA